MVRFFRPPFLTWHRASPPGILRTCPVSSAPGTFSTHTTCQGGRACLRTILPPRTQALPRAAPTAPAVRPPRRGPFTVSLNEALHPWDRHSVVAGHLVAHPGDHRSFGSLLEWAVLDLAGKLTVPKNTLLAWMQRGWVQFRRLPGYRGRAFAARMPLNVSGSARCATRLTAGGIRPCPLN
jgi:hypothetical protein